MATQPLVVARALLRSAAGERPGIDAPITAANVARLAPSPEAAAAVADHFRAAGFDVVAGPGATIGIEGSKALFEKHFGVRLKLGPNQAYGVGAGAKRHSVGLPSDPSSIPAERLPLHIQAAISQIALEAAASFDEPPSTDS